MLALTAGGDDIVGWAVGALAVAYALVLLSTFIPRSTWPTRCSQPADGF